MMTTLTSLPDEVLDVILSYNDISFEDIINFRCVCKKFRWAAKSEENCFPKKKFFQRWPSAKKYYDEQSKEDEQKQSEENKQMNKKSINFIKIGIKYTKQLRNNVYKKMSALICNNIKKVLFRDVLEKKLQDEYNEYLSEENLSRENLSRSLKLSSNIKELSKLFKLMFDNTNYMQILFFMDEIKHLLNYPERPSCDLTSKNCYVILLNSMRICWHNDILEKFLTGEQHYYKELSEESATTWAQQLQLGKNISYSSVKTSLKNITLETLNFFKEKHPEHSIFSTPDDHFLKWENNKIDDNYWDEAEGIQIMETLATYMFDKLKFRPTLSRELEYLCIDYVLENKYGKDIILYIIYQSVARRLGLRCDLVQSSFKLSSLELFWMPKYIFPTDYKKKICLLDEERNKNMKRLQLTHCSQLRNYIFENYMSSMQQLHKETPTEILRLIMITQRPNHFRSLPSTRLIYHLRQFMPETRPKDVKFAVGMIVTHGDDSKGCSTGVIIGWLQTGSKLIFHIENISLTIMPLNMCGYFNAEQTYYIVITKSDKPCCVKEDNINLTKPNWIRNRNIYNYFSKFEGTHYVPNEELAKVYPHDAAIAAGTIFKE